MESLDQDKHEFVEDCDCRSCAIQQRDLAIRLLACWCAAIDKMGTEYFDWAEHYRAASFLTGPLRARIDAEKRKIEEAR